MLVKIILTKDDIKKEYEEKLSNIMSSNVKIEMTLVNVVNGSDFQIELMFEDKNQELLQV